jgi:hypothetical protein
MDRVKYASTNFPTPVPEAASFGAPCDLARSAENADPGIPHRSGRQLESAGHGSGRTPCSAPRVDPLADRLLSTGKRALNGIQRGSTL